MKHDVRIPDIEVVVHVSDWDVAVIAFYADGDIEAGFHVITGVDGHTTPLAIVEVLQEAIKSLRAKCWQSVAQLGASAGEDGEPAPF